MGWVRKSSEPILQRQQKAQKRGNLFHLHLHFHSKLPNHFSFNLPFFLLTQSYELLIIRSLIPTFTTSASRRVPTGIHPPILRRQAVAVDGKHRTGGAKWECSQFAGHGFYDLFLVLNLLVSGGERKGFLTYQNGNNSSCLCFFTRLWWGWLWCLLLPFFIFCLFGFVYMSVLTIKEKIEKMTSWELKEI